jgi:hypothetical protein
MEEAGESSGGQGSYIDKTRTVRCLCPHPLLHYCQYVPLYCASGSVWATKPSKTTCRLSITRKGEGVGQWCRAHLSTAADKLRCLFYFHLLFYYMVLGGPKNWKVIPEHRSSVQESLKSHRKRRGDKESPKICTRLKSCEPLYMCPRPLL